MNLVEPPLIAVQTAVREATDFLESSSVPSARLEAEILLAHLLDIERIELYKSPGRKLDFQEVANYRSLIQRRASGMPTAYLRGRKEFFSLTFEVGPGVLIPRAETEIVVEEGMRLFQKEASLAILDLGTGSGALIAPLLLHYPNSRGVATDVSLEALRYAKTNVQKHGVGNRVQLLPGDLFSPLDKDVLFDLIVSNPPYVPTSQISPELRFEPREALDGGKDGLESYKKIFASAWKYMKQGAFLLLEIGNIDRTTLEKKVKKSLQHYSLLRIQKDLAGLERLLVLTRSSQKTDAKDETGSGQTRPA